MGFAGPVSPVPPRRAVKLRGPSFLVLGMLRLGAKSGYAIKKATDVSTRFFWPTSLAQVYPELARLERHGLVTRRDDSHGARTRSAYEVTEAGQEALLAWLRSPREQAFQFRDEGVLRLFFADAMPEQDQLTHVRRLRERARQASAHLREEIVPLAEVFEQEGVRYPLVVARLGADTYAFAERWLGELEDRLAAGGKL